MKLIKYLNEKKIDYDVLKSSIDDFDDFVEWFGKNGRTDQEEMITKVLQIRKLNKPSEKLKFIEQNIKRATLEKWIPIYLAERDNTQTQAKLGGKYGYFEDNAPSEADWRERQKEIAKDAWDKFIFRNSLTAGFKKPVIMRVSDLIHLKGLNMEHLKIFPGDERVKELEQKMSISGYIGAPVSVSIDGLGKPWIYEGNHRIRAAYNLNIKYIPVEVRYYGCGELVKGFWHPLEILKRAK